LVCLGGKYGQHFTGITFDENFSITIAETPGIMNIPAGQFGSFSDFSGPEIFT
jgi:hypothetical protein